MLFSRVVGQIRVSKSIEDWDDDPFDGKADETKHRDGDHWRNEGKFITPADAAVERIPSLVSYS